MRASHVFLASVVCVMFTASVVGLFFIEPPSGGRESLLVLIGALAAAFGAVVQYWFGSSSGSADKTAALTERMNDPQ